MDCIRVRNNDGIYSFSSSTIEDWENVISHADKYEHVESLKGWDPYTECYKVVSGHEEHLYFVNMPRW